MSVKTITIPCHYMKDAWQGNCDTHQARYFAKVWKHIMDEGIVTNKDDMVIIDPFARDCPLGTITNDLNPETSAEYHLDALEFLATLEDRSADFAILDPPFSDVANERIYGLKSNLYTDSRYFKKVMMELGRILKPGAHLLRFGYTTSTMNRSLELVRLWVVNFYSARNDVLVTLIKNCSHTLGEWTE
jgi:hypothetical protein|tara:strand:- start:1578 stop:2141 length:564 start_codon:yes stop_codon:yes gene_type:complete